MNKRRLRRKIKKKNIDFKEVFYQDVYRRFLSWYFDDFVNCLFSYLDLLRVLVLAFKNISVMMFTD